MSHGHLKPPHLKTIKNTVVLESSIHNWGLWATETIPKGTLLCTLQGQIMTLKEYDDFIKSNQYPQSCFIEKALLDENRIIAIPFRTSYSFINHSDNEEMLEYKKHTDTIDVYAKEDILKNSEIVSIYNLDKHIDVLGGFQKKIVT